MIVDNRKSGACDMRLAIRHFQPSSPTVSVPLWPKYDTTEKKKSTKSKVIYDLNVSSRPIVWLSPNNKAKEAAPSLHEILQHLFQWQYHAMPHPHDIMPECDPYCGFLRLANLSRQTREPTLSFENRNVQKKSFLV
jgi:hypothetical protein